VVALLLAPKSGKETQEDLKRRAKLAKRDLDKMLTDLSSDLVGRIDNLKDAAKDLKGEALEESQELIRRAETLKQDLRASASNLSKAGSQVKNTVVDDAKRLLDEGSAVMNELERVTKKVVASAKDKVKKPASDNQESAS
jgi:gas vesicle protein